MRYYNCRNGQIVYEKPAGLDFGTEHSRTAYSSQHTPRKGTFSTQGLSYPSRPRNSVPHQLFPQAQNYDYAFCFLGALYLSCSRSYEATADFLLNIIGAWDTGNDFSGDALFVFEMELYPVQIEFYVSRNGRIREISRFNQENGDEVGIPVEPDGLLYTMCQVYMNFSPVNFSGGADNRDPLIQKAIFIGQQADYRLILDSPFNRITEDPSAKLKLIDTWGISSRSADRSDDRSGDTGTEGSLGGFDLYQSESDCARLKMMFFLLQAEGKTAEAQDCLRRLEDLRREQERSFGSVESCRGRNDEETLDNIRRGVLDRISGCEEFARWVFEELDAAYVADFDYARGKNTRKFALETGIRPNCFKGTLHGSSSIDGADGPQQFLFLAMEHFFGGRNLQQKVSYRISIVKRIIDEGFKLGILAKYADEKKTAESELKSDTHSAEEKKHSDTSSHQNTENSSSVSSKNETVVLALVIGLVIGLSLWSVYEKKQEKQPHYQIQNSSLVERGNAPAQNKDHSSNRDASLARPSHSPTPDSRQKRPDSLYQIYGPDGLLDKASKNGTVGNEQLSEYLSRSIELLKEENKASYFDLSSLEQTTEQHWDLISRYVDSSRLLNYSDKNQIQRFFLIAKLFEHKLLTRFGNGQKLASNLCGNADGCQEYHLRNIRTGFADEYNQLRDVCKGGYCSEGLVKQQEEKWIEYSEIWVKLAENNKIGRYDAAVLSSFLQEYFLSHLLDMNSRHMQGDYGYISNFALPSSVYNEIVDIYNNMYNGNYSEDEIRSLNSYFSGVVLHAVKNMLVKSGIDENEANGVYHFGGAYDLSYRTFFVASNRIHFGNGYNRTPTEYAKLEGKILRSLHMLYLILPESFLGKIVNNRCSRKTCTQDNYSQVISSANKSYSNLERSCLKGRCGSESLTRQKLNWDAYYFNYDRLLGTMSKSSGSKDHIRTLVYSDYFLRLNRALSTY